MKPSLSQRSWTSAILFLLSLWPTAAISEGKPSSHIIETAAEARPRSITSVWANNGEDKVTRNELRATKKKEINNSVWDGTRVSLFGARNEVVSFNLVLEASASTAERITVSLPSLNGPDGASIQNKETDAREAWRSTGKNIELFFVRYLQIKGVSTLYYNYWGDDDNELHLPYRFRRPHDQSGNGRGTWEDRPDHNTLYPDIAVPLAFHTPFEIPAGSNQSVWIDIYIPKTAPPGKYQGTLEITEGGTLAWQIPVQLDVRKFTLPDLPSARTMLFISRENINKRYLGMSDPNDVSKARQSRLIIDRHFQMAHRHKVSLIDAYEAPEKMKHAWEDRLSGQLFTPERDYDGPGVAVGNNVYSIGTYTTWPWADRDEATFRTAADRWVTLFDSLDLKTPTDYFLYLLDESDEYQKIEEWSKWAHRNPGQGRRLRTLATLDLPKALEKTPSLDIPASTPDPGMSDPYPYAPKSWQKAFDKVRSDPEKTFFLYNGSRPLSGTFALDDDGIAPRQLAWLQYKFKIDRWFVWEGTYYSNFQYDMGDTNVFRNAHTYGGLSGFDTALGETGTNYDNGNGVLFYPGTDKVFPEESYDLAAPIASLRLKHWRRGLQDHDYLTMASKFDPLRVQELVATLLPNGLWQQTRSSSSEADPRHRDISWTTAPDDWEAARRELADIIENGAVQ